MRRRSSSALRIPGSSSPAWAWDRCSPLRARTRTQQRRRARAARARSAVACRTWAPSLRANLAEADHRDDVVARHLAAVELPEEGRHVLGAADLRVVVLDLAGGQVGEGLHLDLVDDRVEHLLARAVARADEHVDDHALPVLARFVAEPDGRRLAVA